MLAERRERRLSASGLSLIRIGTSKAGRSLRLDPHAARLELGIFEQVGDRVDRPAGNNSLFQCGDKVVAFP